MSYIANRAQIIREMEEQMLNAPTCGNAPPETRDFFERKSRFKNIVLGMLSAGDEWEDLEEAILDEIVDNLTGEFDPAGVAAVSGLLAKINKKTMNLKNQLEKTRWLISLLESKIHDL